MSSEEMQRLITDHKKRSHYERDHWVHCYSEDREVRTQIYDPNGNSMTNGDICALINELQDENQELRDSRAIDEQCECGFRDVVCGECGESRN